MRCLFLLCLSVCLIFVFLTNTHSPSSPLPTKQNLCHRNSFCFKRVPNCNTNVEITHEMVMSLLFSISLIPLLWHCCLKLCPQVRYVPFYTNLNLYNKKSIWKSSPCFGCYYLPAVSMLWLLLSEGEKDAIFMQIIINTNFSFLFDLVLQFKKKYL